MKMKVIDLINMHARNEKMPKKIKVEDENEVLTYNGCEYTVDGLPLYEYLDFFDCLNDEVEIIEEDGEIEKISYTDHVGTDLLETVCNKLNEVIDAVNKLKEDN